MMQVVNEIKVDHGLRQQIMQALDVTYPTVRSALRFKSSTRIAEKIREYALKHGGTLMSGIIGSN